jgi:hypothetical protein
LQPGLVTNFAADSPERHCDGANRLFVLPIVLQGTKREHMFGAAVQPRGCVLVWKNGKRACGAADAH